MFLSQRKKKETVLCEHQREERKPEGLVTLENKTGEKATSVHLSEAPHQDRTPQESDQTAVVNENIGCAKCKAEKKAARIYRWKIVAGLFFPFALNALDVTIVASALPFIASDFNQLGQLSWIVSAFNLTSAAFIPAWGQLADIFGRHAALQASMISMLIGSTLCTAAPLNAFPMLLLGRALQGLGCAGVSVLSKIILADKVKLAENSKNNTIFSLIGGLSYGVGPVAGGYLTNISWRWCFGINIPVGLLAIISGFIILRPILLGPQNIPGVDDNGERRASFKMRLSTIDAGGQILFLIGICLLILALTWAGSTYDWSDYRVLVPLISGFVIFVLFIIWEYLMLPGKRLAAKFPLQKPMIPLNIVWSRNAGLLFYINFATGMAMYAVFYFVDLFFVLVEQVGPSRAGLQLLFYTPGIGAGVYLAMYFCNIWPRQTWLPLVLGTIIEPAGITVLAIALRGDKLAVIFTMLGVTGAGTGIRFMPGTLHGVGYFPQNISSIISLMTIAMPLGGIFAMTLMFTIFNNHMRSSGVNLTTAVGSQKYSSLTLINKLPSDSQDYVREQAREGIVLAFLALCGFLWVSVFAVLAMGNVWIGDGERGNKGREEGEGGVMREAVDERREVSGRVAKGAYLATLMKRRQKGGGGEGDEAA